MGLFKEMTDSEAENKINRKAGRYAREAISNYRAARSNGSTPQKAFDFVKADLRKREVNL
jgi:hypothetical protein